MNMTKLCSKCKRNHYALGLCRQHYIAHKYKTDERYRRMFLNATRKWRIKNKDRYNEYMREYRKRRRKNDSKKPSGSGQ